jgi:hypothetical protein
MEPPGSIFQQSVLQLVAGKGGLHPLVRMESVTTPCKLSNADVRKLQYVLRNASKGHIPPAGWQASWRLSLCASVKPFFKTLPS